jgi:hypothetical protein
MKRRIIISSMKKYFDIVIEREEAYRNMNIKSNEEIILQELW